MSSLRLSDLRNKSNKWFKNYGIITKEKRTSQRTIEYFVNRAYEALPKKYKGYLESEKERILNVAIHSIMLEGSESKWNVYEALKQRAQAIYKASGHQTAEFVYKCFREQRPDLYAKYNSYVYRLGFSSAKYFKSNFDYTSQGSRIYADVKLPAKFTGVIYGGLFIEFDFSGKMIISAQMY